MESSFFEKFNIGDLVHYFIFQTNYKFKFLKIQFIFNRPLNNEEFLEADKSLENVAFEYGKNIGMAFQIIDDLLDFVASQEELGKPTSNDLKLGGGF